MLAVLRFRVPAVQAEPFVAEARTVLDVLSARPGYRWARLGRAADDPEVWVLVSEWDGAGAYRRAISASDVKLAATAFLSRAEVAPSAYELVLSDPPPASPGS